MARKTFCSDRPPERILEHPLRNGGPVALSYALVYPNRYALGMANLGYQTVFGSLSGFDGASCHRLFSDSPGTIEAGRSLKGYDVVALSLSFEGDYPAVLDLLAGGGVPLRTEERHAGHPLVVAGGVGISLNPEPLAPFLDAVFLGEAEAGLSGLHDFLRLHRRRPRAELLEALAEARLPGVYVPSRYEVVESAGEVVSRKPLGGAPQTVERLWAPLPWPPARTRILAPEDAFGGAYLLEVSRGCPHACRFCAAGYATRPTRFLPRDVLLPFVEFGVREVGRLGFVGAAVSDHPEFRELAKGVLDAGAQFTVSSFRAENLDEEVLDLLARGGLKTLTVALEAGSERLRRRLGKGLGRDDLVRAAGLAARAGIDSVKIYGMVGLPGEEDDDVRALGELAVEARSEMGKGSVTLSVAPFVPKPHTPLQWEPMASEGVLRSRMRLLESLVGRKRGVRLAVDPPKGARIQGLLSRGGRAVAPLLEEAAARGNWRPALRSDTAADVLDRSRGEGEALPWDFIGGGPHKDHLARERSAGTSGSPAIPCRPGACTACGICGN